jgi:hypothetical protein
MPPIAPPPVLPEVSVFDSIPSEIAAAMVAIEEMFVSRVWRPVPACILNLPMDTSDVPAESPFVFDAVMSLVYMRMAGRGWDIEPIDYANLSNYLTSVHMLNRAFAYLEHIGEIQPSQSVELREI